MRQKISTENRDITLWSIKFFDTRNQWHPKGSPYKIFRHCETKNFRRNILILPPPLIYKIFCYRKFSETQYRRVPLRNVSVLSDNKFSIENRDILLLGIKCFVNRNFLKHRRVPLRKFLVLLDENFFDGKSWYSLPLPSPSHTLTSLIPEVFWITAQKGSFTKCFGTVRQNNFDGESWYPPLLLPLKFSEPRKFLKQKGFLTKSFGTVIQEFLNGKSWYSFA